MISRGWLTHIHNLAQKNVGNVFYFCNVFYVFFNVFNYFSNVFTSMTLLIIQPSTDNYFVVLLYVYAVESFLAQKQLSNRFRRITEISQSIKLDEQRLHGRPYFGMFWIVFSSSLFRFLKTINQVSLPRVRCNPFSTRVIRFSLVTATKHRVTT
jgi:hypothetical protein